MNLKDLLEEVKQIESNAEIIVSWYAKKYNKTIFRIGTLDKEGCRTWEDHKGNKLMCFWDVVLERYTTCINPMITYKNKNN